MLTKEDDSNHEYSGTSAAEIESAKTAEAESNVATPLASFKDGAFPQYSDAELERLLSDIRRLDEDNYFSVAHSAAVKD